MAFEEYRLLNTESPAPDWFKSEAEGQLSVDVFREGNTLVVRSTLAGAKPEDLDIAVNGDLLTIRGTREDKREINEDDWFHQECHWGTFSRSLILPVDVVADQADATLRDGILEVRIPIRGSERHIPVN
ncbi:Hsp20/alpha crystallin family protein [Candidatus Uhrbacteria bacterium]|nr:Hsp20/alpha crystallin family protein [Candidatus Uhrbacteria bacterium]